MPGLVGSGTLYVHPVWIFWYESMVIHSAEVCKNVIMSDSAREVYQTRIFVTVHIECCLAGESLGMKLLSKYCCRCEDVIKLELHDRVCENDT